MSLTDEQIEAIFNSLDGRRVIAGENQLNWNRAIRIAFARAIEVAVQPEQQKTSVHQAVNGSSDVRGDTGRETVKGQIQYCNTGNRCPWGEESAPEWRSICRACGRRAQGSGQ